MKRNSFEMINEKRNEKKTVIKMTSRIDNKAIIIIRISTT